MPEDFDFHENLESGVVWVSSRIRLWWLTQVHDYEVVTTRQVPRSTPMGTVRFDRRWLLRPGSNGRNGNGRAR